MSTKENEHLKYFKDHVLDRKAESLVIVWDGVVVPYEVTVYTLRRPGTRDYSCQLTFTPEGICIQGDITPEDNNGSCSRGKSLKWFAGENHPDYLASYFLTKKWVPELAKKELEAELQEVVKEFEAYLPDWNLSNEAKSYQAEKELLEQLIAGVSDQNELSFTTTLAYEGYGFSDEVPGWGYCPTEVSILSAIQQTFRRLYWEGRDE